ncbi:MAG: hypothetical protein HQ568_07740, partial [Calditrichaeota bacterium]|nr:hypothetical protein [Calditrichota bacterium]
MLSWNDHIEEINGLGPKRSEFLKEKGFKSIGDLLLLAPLRFIDRRGALPLKELENPQSGEITAIGKVETFGETGYGKKRRYNVYIGDGTGFLVGTWFKTYNYIKPKIKPDIK